MQKVIHFNPRLQHQVDHAMAFQKAGFGITSDPNDVADIHVISGNWYAYSQWRDHPRCLMIDRAFWGDSEGYVSIGWLQPDGSRKFATGTEPRPHPEHRGWKQGWDVSPSSALSCLILADYNQDIDPIVEEARKHYVQVEVRHHPQDQRRGKFDRIPLEIQVGWYDCAICTGGTAGFEAIMAGVPTICLDPTSPLMPVCTSEIGGKLYRGDTSDWLHDLSYAQWRIDEIPQAWELLKDLQ